MANDLNQPASLVGDREIITVRVFDAPRDLVFKVWTDPNHMARWWGPNGFTTTTFAMEVKPGGVWRFVMHGPDGRDYQNKITYLEVVEPERLVFKHGGAKDVEPVSHTTHVTFDDLGGKTKLTMRMVFPSSAAREYVVKTYGAVDGLTQTITRLGEYLPRVGPASKEFVISREFDAPRDLVWRAWSERDRLAQWFGPKGFVVEKSTLDFRPGGTFHFLLRSPEGQEMWAKFVYRQIIPPQRIAWVHSFSDANGGVTRHPGAPDWPPELDATATFAEHDGKTVVTVRWTPINPTDAERRTFEDGLAGMTTGWTGTFEQLDEYLAKSKG